MICVDCEAVRVNDWSEWPAGLVAVIVSGKEPPVLGVPARVAVPSPLSVKETPAGRAPVLVRVVDVGKPGVVVTVKLPALHAVNVTWSKLVIAGSAATVSVNDWSEWPAG